MMKECGANVVGACIRQRFRSRGSLGIQFTPVVDFCLAMGVSELVE